MKGTFFTLRGPTFQEVEGFSILSFPTVDG